MGGVPRICSISQKASNGTAIRQVFVRHPRPVLPLYRTVPLKGVFSQQNVRCPNKTWSRARCLGNTSAWEHGQKKDPNLGLTKSDHVFTVGKLWVRLGQITAYMVKNPTPTQKCYPGTGP
jgi:hypothetical protein